MPLFNLQPVSISIPGIRAVEIQQKNTLNGQNVNMEIKAAHAISYTIL